MVQSIELLFDAAAETALREAWSALAAAGLPSLASHTGATNRPHVTVAVTEGEFAEPVVAALRAVFAGWDLVGRGLAAEVGAPLLFGAGDRRVLVRQIVPSRRLLTLHEAVHRAIADHDACLEVTRTDRWSPHVTLASRMPLERIGEALAVIDAAVIDCRFTTARLWNSVAKTVTPLS